MDEKVTQAEEKQEVETSNSLDELKAELDRLKEENGKLKNAQSNASADASKYKKALQERMTEQEKAAQETKDLIEQLKAENATMKRNQFVAERTAEYIGIGFDTDLAKQAAEATADNNHEVFLNYLKTFLTAHDKALQADALRATPRPGTGASSQGITKEQFAKMKYSDRVKLHDENPELYNQLMKK